MVNTRTCAEEENIGTVEYRQPKVYTPCKLITGGLKGGIKGIPEEGILQEYCLEDEVNALLHDAIIPQPKPRTVKRRRPPPNDMRNAGIFSGGWNLINPPSETKFMDLVNDVKETTYASYWNKPLGSSRDITPLLPEEYVRKDVRFGKSTKSEESLYDIIFPVNKCSEQELHLVGVRSKLNYSKPAFDENKTFGYRYQRSSSVECCLKYENILLGKNLLSLVDVKQAEHQKATTPKLGLPMTPNDNINSVPEEFRFGLPTKKLKETTASCLNYCKVKPEKAFLHDCLRHLNSVHECLRKSHPHTLFRTYYLKLKFMDECKTGWLPREEIYDFCNRNRIFFQPNFIEPLLSMWSIFDGSNIQYETFIRVLNYREPSLEFPKLQDIDKNCLDFRTTYGEMVKPHDNRKTGGDWTLRAGLPKSRYFDLDYHMVPYRSSDANIIGFPEESHAFSQMVPCTFANYDVTIQDMYATRDQKTIRRVFEASGEKFTEEKFQKVWSEAEKYHSKGVVCYETFRKALSVF